jgi:hypothetical protein
MPLAAYRDVSFLVRAVRVLPVVAVAASIGGIIGGFTVYAVDSALTWQPSSSRLDARAENQPASQAGSAEQQKMRPARIVGGAIPDPSAGMSAPPPVLQPPQSPPQQSSAPQNPPQVSPQVLSGKPLGPAASLQPGDATQGPTQRATPSAGQNARQGTNPPPSAPPSTPPSAKPVQTQSVPVAPAQQRADQPPNTAPAQQQPTRWPDALSRARQQPSSGAQPQPPVAQPNAPAESATTQNMKDKGNERAANANDEDRGTSRRERRRQRLEARAYDRVYNSYGNPRAQEESSGSRSDTDRRYGRSSRYRSRSRDLPERQDIDRDVDRGQSDRGNRERATEAARPRPEPFWGGGFLRRDGRFGDDD